VAAAVGNLLNKIPYIYKMNARSLFRRSFFCTCIFLNFIVGICFDDLYQKQRYRCFNKKPTNQLNYK